MKFHREPSIVQEAVDLLDTRILRVSPVQFNVPVSRDLEDDPVIGTAVAGLAECIITGDKDLLSLRHYRGIRIVNPASFLAEAQAD